MLSERWRYEDAARADRDSVPPFMGDAATADTERPAPCEVYRDGEPCAASAECPMCDAARTAATQAARAEYDRDLAVFSAACDQCGEATAPGETFCSLACEDERREEDQRGDAIAARVAREAEEDGDRFVASVLAEVCR